MNRKNNALKRKAIGVATCLKGHDHGQALVTFIYNTDNPLAFGMSFRYGEAADPDNIRTLTMWFSRDYVAEWLQDAMLGTSLSLGETVLRISKRYGYIMTFKFPPVVLSTGESINLMIRLSREFVTKFLADTYSVIPQASPAETVWVDSCIAELLKPKA